MTEIVFRCKDCKFYEFNKTDRVGFLCCCEEGKWVTAYDPPCEESELRKGGEE